MNSSVFLRFLQEEYMNLLGRQEKKDSLFRKRKPLEYGSSCSIPAAQLEKYIGIEEEICYFKGFIIQMIQTERVQLSDASEIPAAEYLSHMALERSRVPPFKPLYPQLISILKLFNEKEIEEYFGLGYLQSYRRMLAVYAAP